MKGRHWTRSGWFWAGALLATMAVTVFAYTAYLRQAVIQVHEDYLQLQREIVALLRTIEDHGGMEAAWPTLLVQRERGELLAERAAGLPRPSSQLEMELAEKYGPELKALVKELNDQRLRILRLPDGDAIWQKFETLKSGEVPPSLIQQGNMP